MMENDYKELIEYLREISDGSEADMQFFLCMDVLESMKKTALYLKKNENTIPPTETYTKLKKIFIGFEIINPIIKKQFKDVKALLMYRT